MNLKLIVLIWSLLAIGSLKAQLLEVDNNTSKTYELQSQILEEKREIQVYLPKGYHESDTTYPVLYLLDGQRFFDHAVSLAKSFDQFRLTPEFIIVGISNKYPDRFSYFSTQSSQFARFIKEEVITNIDAQFATADERFLFGWEYGGGFVLEMLAKKPDLFDGYVAASIYPVNVKLEMLDSLLNVGVSQPTKLFFSSAKAEGIVNEEAILLKNLLEQNPNKYLKWVYLELANEEHRSTPYSTLYHGIKNYYYYYPVLQFATFDEFKDFGGMKSVEHYYLKRSEQFEFAPEVPLWTKFSIIRTAIRDDNFEEFKRLSDLYVNEELVQGLRNNQPYSLSDYMIENGMHQEAIDVYLALLTKRPDSKKLLTKLAESYGELGNRKESNKYRRMAEKAESR